MEQKTAIYDKLVTAHGKITRQRKAIRSADGTTASITASAGKTFRFEVEDDNKLSNFHFDCDLSVGATGGTFTSVQKGYAMFGRLRILYDGVEKVNNEDTGFVANQRCMYEKDQKYFEGLSGFYANFQTTALLKTRYASAAVNKVSFNMKMLDNMLGQTFPLAERDVQGRVFKRHKLEIYVTILPANNWVFIDGTAPTATLANVRISATRLIEDATSLRNTEPQSSVIAWKGFDIARLGNEASNDVGNTFLLNRHYKYLTGVLVARRLQTLTTPTVDDLSIQSKFSTSLTYYFNMNGDLYPNQETVDCSNRAGEAQLEARAVFGGKDPLFTWDGDTGAEFYSNKFLYGCSFVPEHYHQENTGHKFLNMGIDTNNTAGSNQFIYTKTAEAVAHYLDVIYVHDRIMDLSSGRLEY